MARPLKKGIDYYPLEVTMDTDDKFFDLFDEIGTATGLGIVIILLNSLYENEGYFMKWNDSVCKKICRNKHIDKDTLTTAIRHLTGHAKSSADLKEDPPFFDPHLFKHDKILTSKSIQNRYFIATERRKERFISLQYFLLDYKKGHIQTGTRMEKGTRLPIMEDTYYVTIDKKNISFEFVVSGHIEDNVNINEVNVCNNSVNADISTQNRPEEIITDQSIVKEKEIITEDIKENEIIKKEEDNIISITRSTNPFDNFTPQKKSEIAGLSDYSEDEVNERLRNLSTDGINQNVEEL